jgi:hypothetical protein
VIIATYNDHLRLLSPGPWLVGATKAYSGVGADIVMKSIWGDLSPTKGVYSAFGKSDGPCCFFTTFLTTPVFSFGS